MKMPVNTNLVTKLLCLTLVSSLLTLTGCKDSLGNEPKSANKTEHNSSLQLSDTVNTSKKNKIDDATLTDAKAKNLNELSVLDTTNSINATNNDVGNLREKDHSPRFARVTNFLALRPGNEWSWDRLTNMPGINDWINQTPDSSMFETNYSINGSLDFNGGMIAYGTKEKPNLITFVSGQGIEDDETGSRTYHLDDLFYTSELTRVPSNCDVGEDDDLVVQRFYIWKKQGYQTLYVFSLIDVANAGTTTHFGIAKSFDEFFKPDYANAYLDIRNHVDLKQDSCIFSD